jgi:hypothetical protein
MVTQAELHHHFDYDVDQGLLIWKKPTSQRVKVGEAFGAIGTTGYRRGRLNGTSHQHSHLVWIYHNGPFEQGFVIDHVDKNQGNDRISNLRPATRTQNTFNAGAHRDNKLGLKGVYEHKPGVYRSSVMINGRVKRLGCFKSPMEAHLTYLEAAKALVGKDFVLVEV